MYKFAILNTHPIQYFAPLYRRLAQETDIDLTVYFCSRLGFASWALMVLDTLDSPINIEVCKLSISSFGNGGRALCLPAA